MPDYAQPQATFEAHSARVLQMLDLRQRAAGMPTLSAEQLIEKLPAAMLARIVELIAWRTTALPTEVVTGESSVQESVPNPYR